MGDTTHLKSSILLVYAQDSLNEGRSGEYHTWGAPLLGGKAKLVLDKSMVVPKPPEAVVGVLGVRDRSSCMEGPAVGVLTEKNGAEEAPNAAISPVPGRLDGCGANSERSKSIRDKLVSESVGKSQQSVWQTD